VRERINGNTGRMERGGGSMICVFHERPFMRRHIATWARLSTTSEMHNRWERHTGREAVGARVDGGFSGRVSLIAPHPNKW